MTRNLLISLFIVLCSLPAFAADAIDREPIFDGGLKGKWQDGGWCPRDLEGAKPARLNFSNFGGWTLIRPGLSGNYAVLSFRLLAPPKFGNFLEIQLGTENDRSLPRVQVTIEHRRHLAEGWVEINVPLTQLNPTRGAFDRITLRANRLVGSDLVDIDAIALISTQSTDANEFPVASKSRRTALQIDCTKPVRKISPAIYGVTFIPNKAGSDQHVWRSNPTARAFGTPAASRYNWQLGNAWNSANEAYFTNSNLTGIADYSWQDFLDGNRQHMVSSAITVPMLGWVAKDTQSYSYPVSVFGPQRSTPGSNPNAGNGFKPNGQAITGADPKSTSVPSNPQSIAQWVSAIRQHNDKNKVTSAPLYYLDYEPMQWHTRHRDVHPEPVTYDELWTRTVTYAEAIHEADPRASIAGPASAGWLDYFYSAKDILDKTAKIDRQEHGDKPLLAWYLRQLAQYEKKNGRRLIDMLDVHFFPAVDGIYFHERNDPATAAARIRSTRSLWDPTYRDDDGVGDTIRLLPRLKALIAESKANVEVSIGAYNFGGEQHISGGLAQAEALGRFAQEGVSTAFYSGAISDQSPVYYAFKSFRNFDGQGATFQNFSIATASSKNTSVFASKNETGDHLVAIALNFDLDQSSDAEVFLTGCGEVMSGRVFQYAGTDKGLENIPGKFAGKGGIKQTLAPASITVFDFKMNTRKK